MDGDIRPRAVKWGDSAPTYPTLMAASLSFRRQADLAADGLFLVLAADWLVLWLVFTLDLVDAQSHPFLHGQCQTLNFQ